MRTRVWLLLWAVACGTQVAPTRSPAVAPTPVPSEVAPPTAARERSRGDPALFAVLEPALVDAIPDARLLGVGETFADGRARAVGPGFTLAFDYRAYAARQRAYVPNGHVFAAVQFLRELEAAGVDLGATGRHLATERGSLACRDVGQVEPEIRCRPAEEPPVSRATLERPSYLEPPSTRPRPQSPPRPHPSPSSTWIELAPLTDVLGCHLDMEVRGLPLGDAHQALLVTADVPVVGAALCIVGETLHCTDTILDGLDGVVQATSTGWLLVGHSSYGNHRSGETLLVSLSLVDEMASVDTLGMGAVSGHGEGCVDQPGYCVWMEGSLIRLRAVGEGCVERKHEGGWTATHVRVGDRWIDEVVTPREGGPCIERYAIGPDGFERTSCGPSSETPACPDDLETLTAR